MMLVTGASGFLGKAVCQELDRRGRRYHTISGHEDYDLRARDLPLTDGIVIDTVIHLAYPGTDGIQTMLTTPFTLVDHQLQIDTRVVRACAQADQYVRLLCTGSVCSYPEQVTYPTDESQFWAGYPEATNAAFGVAKRMTLELLRAAQREDGLRWSYLILDNLYGPGDCSGHVIPATIGKVLDAQAKGASSISVWGDGTATREFLHVEDAARGIVDAVEHPEVDGQPINLCSGEETPIALLVERIRTLCGYAGDVVWDPTKPNGQPRRWFSHDKATALLGWTPQVSFLQGLQQTVQTAQVARGLHA